MPDNYSIYIMCASREAGDAVQAHFVETGLPDPRIFIGDNYYLFINHVMKDCPTEYALICHDDVILPATIGEQVARCILKADAEFGAGGWAFIGNAGVDCINYRVMRFVTDAHEKPLPWTSTHPYPAAHLDGNTLLAQVRNCRARGFAMPAGLRGPYLYDLVLVMESYLKGLACGIDSTLFVIHKGVYDQAAFDACGRDQKLVAYLKERFINHSFITTNGLIRIANTIHYLSRSAPDERKGFYTDCIEPVLSAIYSAKPRKKLYLVTITDGKKRNKIRRLLDSVRVAAAAAAPVIDFAMTVVLGGDESPERETLDAIAEEYRDIPVRVKKNLRPCDEGFELVSAFAATAGDGTDDEESYFWFINADDFIMPSVFPSLPMVLHREAFTAGDVQVFDERWDESDRSVPYQVSRGRRIESSSYYAWLTGKQLLLKSALICPVRLIREISAGEKDIGSQSDEAFLMRIARYATVDTVPLVMTGVSGDHDDKNGVDVQTLKNVFQHASALPQPVNAGVMRKINHDYLYQLEGEIGNVRGPVLYRIVQSMINNRQIQSLYKMMKPLAWPLIRLVARKREGR